MREGLEPNRNDFIRIALGKWTFTATVAAAAARTELDKSSLDDRALASAPFPPTAQHISNGNCDWKNFFRCTHSLAGLQNPAWLDDLALLHSFQHQLSPSGTSRYRLCTGRDKIASAYAHIVVLHAMRHFPFYHPWLLLKSPPLTSRVPTTTNCYSIRSHSCYRRVDSEWFIWEDTKQAGRLGISIPAPPSSLLLSFPLQHSISFQQYSQHSANSSRPFSNRSIQPRVADIVTSLRIAERQITVITQHSAESRRQCHYASQNRRLHFESASHLGRVTTLKLGKMTSFTPLCNPFANLRVEAPDNLAIRKTLEDMAHRETPNDLAMPDFALPEGVDSWSLATPSTPSGEDDPDDTFPSFEEALGPDFNGCNTLAIKRFRHMPLHPQHLRPITAFEDIRFVLRSMRLEALQERHAAIKAAADKDRARIALVASPRFSEAMVKRNSQRRKRRREAAHQESSGARSQGWQRSQPMTSLLWKSGAPRLQEGHTLPTMRESGPIHAVPKGLGILHSQHPASLEQFRAVPKNSTKAIESRDIPESLRRQEKSRTSPGLSSPLVFRFRKRQTLIRSDNSVSLESDCCWAGRSSRFGTSVTGFAIFTRSVACWAGRIVATLRSYGHRSPDGSELRRHKMSAPRSTLQGKSVLVWQGVSLKRGSCWAGTLECGSCWAGFAGNDSLRFGNSLGYTVSNAVTAGLVFGNGLFSNAATAGLYMTSWSGMGVSLQRGHCWAGITVYNAAIVGLGLLANKRDHMAWHSSLPKTFSRRNRALDHPSRFPDGTRPNAEPPTKLGHLQVGLLNDDKRTVRSQTIHHRCASSRAEERRPSKTELGQYKPIIDASDSFSERMMKNDADERNKTPIPRLKQTITEPSLPLREITASKSREMTLLSPAGRNDPTPSRCRKSHIPAPKPCLRHVSLVAIEVASSRTSQPFRFLQRPMFTSTSHGSTASRMLLKFQFRIWLQRVEDASTTHLVTDKSRAVVSQHTFWKTTTKIRTSTDLYASVIEKNPKSHRDSTHLLETHETTNFLNRNQLKQKAGSQYGWFSGWPLKRTAPPMSAYVSNFTLGPRPITNRLKHHDCFYREEEFHTTGHTQFAVGKGPKDWIAMLYFERQNCRGESKNPKLEASARPDQRKPHACPSLTDGKEMAARLKFHSDTRGLPGSTKPLRFVSRGIRGFFFFFFFGCDPEPWSLGLGWLKIKQRTTDGMGRRTGLFTELLESWEGGNVGSRGGGFLEVVATDGHFISYDEDV
ncbi:uncharacterized protein MYCFIDRAFT_171039 [Pseudocercospora fijiensis CIRAD86]|uniref:Uncharacterized protein n=1 Tax=Pseudocercospora fijiensis (strain CIRAD86) TaxID=383855 RepID=N1Q9P0_PSEFD|nr:uncharacterized protein MYCFIDRAFT_171039 [Pseudocercospora fijiensis CIRAD86]EME89615.1 hypothetical protein MYCFIDRAFT_171039 [Pseudocercospora fijiensis CIRAD86]